METLAFSLVCYRFCFFSFLFCFAVFQAFFTCYLLLAITIIISFHFISFFSFVIVGISIIIIVFFLVCIYILLLCFSLFFIFFSSKRRCGTDLIFSFWKKMITFVPLALFHFLYDTVGRCTCACMYLGMEKGRQTIQWKSFVSFSHYAFKNNLFFHYSLENSNVKNPLLFSHFDP